MATAELLRLSEVQSCITSDFLLLPCDLVCEINGTHLLQTWIASQDREALPDKQDSGGGLCVYYQSEERTEDEVPDLIAVTPHRQPKVSTIPRNSLGLSRLLMSTGMDSMKRKLEKDKGFLLRHSLAKKHAKVKILTGYRDAHLYAFPYWVKDLVRHQERLVSVSEDLIGLWAKSTWQRRLGEKLGINACLDQQKKRHGVDGCRQPLQDGSPNIPPLLAYLQTKSMQLIRRVDSPALLFSTSLRLAKLESIEDIDHTAIPSPFAHEQKIASPEGVAPRCYISTADCLLGHGVIVEEKSVIKECCIGPNSRIGSSARLTRCVVLDHVVVGERCVLTDCIIGSRSTIGRDSVLRDCEVQQGYVVPEETEGKNERFMPLFEDLEDRCMDDFEAIEENYGCLTGSDSL
jgi:translation initiation factor eIF-2B subunit gamma